MRAIASFPPASGAQATIAGSADAFAAKLNPAGSTLLYFTLLGGSQVDSAKAIAVDPNGNAFIGGSTASPDFPVTPGAVQTVFGGATDGFIAKLNSTGSTFQYVTYLGSNRDESVRALAIDALGNTYVTGSTASARFPTVSPIDAGLTGNANSLYRTTDGGTSWAPMDNTIPGTVTSVSPDPTPGVLVAATTAGIYRSIDSGQTWTQVSNLKSATLSRSPADSSVIYEINDSFNLGRSLDGGLTWGYRGATFEPQSYVAADPADAHIVYAYDDVLEDFYPFLPEEFISYQRVKLSTGFPCSGYGVASLVIASDGTLYVDFANCGVYKSSSSVNATWASANSGLPPNRISHGLAVSPSNPSVLYRSNSSNPVYVTTNGGSSWAPTGTPPAPLGPLAVSAANPSTLYAGALGGPQAIYVSQDGGNTWNPAGSGLGAARVSQIQLDPSNQAGAYALEPVNAEAFVTEINPAGSGLVYSTYLGSIGLYSPTAIALNHGDAIVTGTGGPPVPYSTLAPQAPNGGVSAIVARISSASASCRVSVSPASQTVYGVGATVLYQVLAPAGCAWTASSDSSWATIMQGASGAGSSIVFVSVSPNTTGATRTASLTIGGQTVAIVQADSSCNYSVNAGNFLTGPAGGVLQVVVTVAAGCPWTVENQDPTDSVTSPTTGSGNGTVTVNVAPAAWRQLHWFGLIYIANAGLSPVQLTPCNVAQTTVASAADVQSVIDEALGVAPLAHDLNHDGVVNLVDTQIVSRFVLDYQCRTQ